MFLDTDVLTWLFFKKPAVVERRDAVPDTIAVGLTVVSRAELLGGRLDAILKADTPLRVVQAQERLWKTDVFLAGFGPPAPLDADSAALFFDLRSQRPFARTGRADLMNAAIAIVHGATLVTRNVRDYERIPRLKLETW